MANFCRHRHNNPDAELEFRYITTAAIAVEQGWPLAKGAIDTWIALRRGAFGESGRGEAIAAIREFLLTCDQPAKTSDEAWQALCDSLAGDAETFLTQIVLPFEWGAGYGNYQNVEEEVVAALSTHSYAQYGTPESIFEHLFAYVFRLLCLPGRKVLTPSQLLEELAKPSITPPERAILGLLRNELGSIRQEIFDVKTSVQQQMEALSDKVGELGKAFGIGSQFALSAAVFSSDPPERLAGGATRSTAVTNILDLLQASPTVMLFGEFGCGKTQLLLLTSGKLSQRQFWLNIPREASEAQADAMLETFLRSLASTTERLPFRQMCEVACRQLGDAVVIFDDLPRIIPRGQFATRVETFANNLRTAGGTLLMASYFPLPETLAGSIGSARYDVRRFETRDVLDLFSANGAPALISTEKVADLLVTVTEGLPVLVMAAVRYLQGQNWHITHTELESLFKGEFAAAHRHDTASLLQFIIKDSEERELLARMSLAIGDFSMDDIASVARVRTRILWWARRSSGLLVSGYRRTVMADSHVLPSLRRRWPMRSIRVQIEECISFWRCRYSSARRSLQSRFSPPSTIFCWRRQKWQLRWFSCRRSCPWSRWKRRSKTTLALPEFGRALRLTTTSRSIFSCI